MALNVTQEEFQKLMGQPTQDAPQASTNAPGSTTTPPPNPEGGWKTVIPAGKAMDLKQFPGRPIEGELVGKTETPSKFKTPEGKDRIQYVWQFKGPSGNFEVYGFTNLDKALKCLSPGAYVRMTYQGKQVTAKGQMAHMVSVETR